ncbi:DUF3617 domain-containing protein [Stutzerimonas stutzeri]|uniref:DUF3617 domain-containing protein n=1 Tax=Stutzerimonas stutzeri TaxID=316 RepID=UPI00265841FF|nr:DUF3617 domain-containing protein [Stutzerimonas stutzeri]MCF6781118.1 DUF3617 domain-containing protein [Stutzerimonas stutzeri]MCF6805014.1 DUF3617 domain-containing protein [Stutzerimonas stutzeri]
MNRLLTALTFTALSFSLPAQAAPIQPGLWEFSSRNVEVDGQEMPGMNEMLEQLQNLPPEQRKMMEDMLAAQGVQLGGQGVRICLSEAQVSAEALPFSDQPDCTQEITERSERRWKFSFSCPEASGQGETRFISEREFVSVMETSYSVGGEQGSSRMESHARWVGEDCGTLKPAK